MSRSESAHQVEMERQEAHQRAREASQAAYEAEVALMRQCPLCDPMRRGGHHARLQRHDDHVKDLPEGWVMSGARMASNPSGVSPGTAQVALPGVPGTPHPETPGNP